ncbi:hypothetical protein RIF29_03628 [Crotalaria pallida]|uniref:RNase H type-1 domain-containing protein n=1 Tax=Crotalaria pallida TaxID=3830 RepID=A0AAN9J116_CROPI
MTWRGISKACETMYGNLFWILGNGSRVRFWLDPWIPGKPTLINIPGVVVPHWGREFTVSNFSDNGRWRWNLFDASLPQEIKSILAAMIPPSMSQEDDSIAWSRETNGEFSIPSAVAILQDGAAEQKTENPYRANANGFLRGQTDQLKVKHERLLTNAERVHRGMGMVDLCPRCQVGFMKLNTDGSFRASSHAAACGGVIRDATGFFVHGFHCNLGVCSSVKAELWSLLWGLRLAKHLEIFIWRWRWTPELLFH